MLNYEPPDLKRFCCCSIGWLTMPLHCLGKPLREREKTLTPERAKVVVAIFWSAVLFCKGWRGTAVFWLGLAERLRWTEMSLGKVAGIMKSCALTPGQDATATALPSENKTNHDWKGKWRCTLKCIFLSHRFFVALPNRGETCCWGHKGCNKVYGTTYRSLRCK